MWFWIIASLTIAILALFFIATLLRGREAGQTAAEYDLQIYRDQLKSIERDQERGVVSDEDAARIKTEISHRILAADKASQNEGTAGKAPLGLTIAVIVLCVAGLLGSLAIYSKIGASGYPDLPLKQRISDAQEIMDNRPSQKAAEARTPPSQTKADPQHIGLVKQLRSAVADNPDDLKGHELLAVNEARLGNYTAAYRARIRVIELKRGKATALDFADLANLMIMAAGGFVSPEAETALKQSLQRDPQHGTALYYTGLMYAQSGRPDVAFRIWRDLLDRSAPDDPWVRPIRGQIQDAASWAGVRYTLSEQQEVAAAPGPSAEDIEAAGEMSAEDRQDMIKNMVSQLADRLATEGGSAQEWARLISAIGVMGDQERARRIWGEAQQVFAGNAAELEMIRAAAKAAGVAE